MKNTLENKAKFVAQYWGQNIGIASYLDEPVYKTLINTLTFDSIKQVELKPLSSISDEDLKESGYQMSPKLFLDRVLQTSRFGADFLRSKGYAIPWNGISVEEMIEFGWIKLKE